MDSFYFTEREDNKPKSRAMLIALSFAAFFGILGTIVLLKSSNGSPLSLHQFQIEEQEFQQFLRDYGKAYDCETEYQLRFKIFRDNSAFIRLHNSLGRDWILGFNKFADISFSEFQQIYLPSNLEIPTPLPEEMETFDPDLAIPTTWDWRTKGVITPIKDQGSCGSCWAFSTISGTESIWALSGNPLIDLSEQQLMDCSGSYGNSGCYGGSYVYAYPYVRDKGVSLESVYPYKGKLGSCNQTLQNSPAAKIKNAYFVSSNNPTALLNAVSIRPVSIAVQADQAAWQLYKSGIVTGSCGTNLNHAVNIVGYNTVNDPNFWIIRNSWGTWWGESGYIRIIISSGNGVCGVNMMPLYPVN